MAKQVNCLNCKTLYEEKEVDPYLCSPCLEAKKALAVEIDAKVKSSEKEHISGIQLYDSLPKVRGFVRAKDLGIL